MGTDQGKLGNMHALGIIADTTAATAKLEQLLLDHPTHL